MGDERLDEYRLGQVEQKADEAIRRVGAVEAKGDLRDAKVAVLTEVVKRNSQWMGAVVLAIVAAALGIIFGVGGN